MNTNESALARESLLPLSPNDRASVTLPPKTSRPRLTLALGLALGAGAALRLVTLAIEPSLYIDEAMLALNIGTRSLSGLLHPLDYGQTAPIVFLWAERLVVKVAGMSEVSLRAIPFLAGLALPVALWRLARRLLTPDGAALAAAFAALAPILIEFSGMLKPYTLDALVTVGLLLLAIDLQEVPAARHWWRLVLGGAAGLLLSQPAAFVLAGVGAALVSSSQVRSTPTRAAAAPWIVAASLSWGSVFAALYFAFYRGTATSTYMQEYWSSSFFSLGSPALLDNVRLASDAIFFNIFVGSRPPYAVIVLFMTLCAVGAVSLWRRVGPWAALLVTGPIAAVVAASALRRYPIAPRVMVFAVPLLILLMAEALAAAVALLRHPAARRIAHVGVVAWIVLIAVIGTTQRRFPPRVRPVIERLARSAPPGATVYLFANAEPMWAFYTTDWSAPDTARLRWFAQAASPGGPAFHNAFTRSQPVGDEGAELMWRSAGRREILGVPTGMQTRELSRLTRFDPDSGWAANEVRRMLAADSPEVWLFFANVYRLERLQLLACLEVAGGLRLYEFETSGAWLYRYRLPEPAPGRRSAAPGWSPCDPRPHTEGAP